jgi:transcriptional regulator with XRE-family HTH domain
LREQLGYSQVHVEEVTGINRIELSDFERGKRTPGAWSVLARLAQLYETSADYILGLTPSPLPIPRSEEENIRRAHLLETKRLMMLLDELSQESRTLVIELAMRMAVAEELAETRQRELVAVYEHLIMTFGDEEARRQLTEIQERLAGPELDDAPEGLPGAGDLVKNNPLLSVATPPNGPSRK